MFLELKFKAGSTITLHLKKREPELQRTETSGGSDDHSVTLSQVLEQN